MDQCGNHDQQDNADQCNCKTRIEAVWRVLKMNGMGTFGDLEGNKGIFKSSHINGTSVDGNGPAGVIRDRGNDASVCRSGDRCIYTGACVSGNLHWRLIENLIELL